jgi:hypothetical protein
MFKKKEADEYLSLAPSTGRLRQNDCEFKACQGYIVRQSQKTSKETPTTTKSPIRPPPPQSPTSQKADEYTKWFQQNLM